MSDFTAIPAVLAKVYRSTSGHPTTPTWSEIDGARDISTNADKRDAVEAGGRGRRYKGYILARGDYDLTIQLPCNAGDADWEAFNDAHAAGPDSSTQLLYLAVVSGGITADGTRGIKGYFVITDKSEPYPMDGGMFTDWTLKPAATAADLAAVKIVVTPP